MRRVQNIWAVPQDIISGPYLTSVSNKQGKEVTSNVCLKSVYKNTGCLPYDDFRVDHCEAQLLRMINLKADFDLSIKHGTGQYFMHELF